MKVFSNVILVLIGGQSLEFVLFFSTEIMTRKEHQNERFVSNGANRNSSRFLVRLYVCDIPAPRPHSET